jgi:DNA polymerase I
LSLCSPLHKALFAGGFLVPPYAKIGGMSDVNTTTAGTASPANSKPKLVLIDGHALAYRMYFALENTAMATRADKTPTWAVYGFFTALFTMLKRVKPDALIVTFDVSRESFRNTIYPAYKAHRDHMPEALQTQMGLIRQGIDALHIPVFAEANYEADDLIGTLSLQGKHAGYEVQILTGDQDAFQLVEDGAVYVLLPARNPKEDVRLFDRQAVIDKWGVTPEQVVDFKALKGDTSDNIPGVPGIGDKTAAKLLGQFGTLEALYQQLPLAGTLKLQDKLTQYKDQAFLSQQLATIIRNVPISADWHACAMALPDASAWTAFCQQLEFRAFLQGEAGILGLFNYQVTGDVADPATQLAEQTAANETASSTPETPEILGLGAPYTPDFTLVDTPQAFATLLTVLQQAAIIAIDVETVGLDVRDNPLIGIALAVVNTGLSVVEAPISNPLHLDACAPTRQQLLATGDYGIQQVFYIPLAHTHEDSHNLPLTDVLAGLKPLLEDATKVKIAHNAKFERTVFRQYDIALNGMAFDTMIASYVLAPERRHGLKALSVGCLGLYMVEYESLVGKGKQHVPFAQLPLSQTAPYAAADAAVCLQLAHLFTQQLSDKPTLQTLLYEVELPLEAVLAEMEWQGITLDVPYLNTLSHQLDDRLSGLERDIYHQAGDFTFNMNSPKQVGEVLFDRLGIAPLKKTSTKAFSTDAQVLEQLRTAHPIIPLMLDYRQSFKLKSTYIDALPMLVHPLTGRLHTHFNQTVTATGRLSSSNPNLQNIPIRSAMGKAIRRAFIPQPGWVLLSADYSQIELRMLAHYSQDPFLVKAFNEGQDIHTATAALVFDVPLEAVTKEMRYKAKTVNFGVIYGQSAHSLSQQLGVSRAEAQAFINLYFMRYSTIKSCIEGIQHEAHQTGMVSTLLGRQRNLSQELNSRNRSIREFAERAAFNTPLQGSSADLIKLAMIRLLARLKAENCQARLLLQVHDEMVLEAPPEEVDAVTSHIEWAMALNQPLHVPLVCDVAVGPTWLEA